MNRLHLIPTMYLDLHHSVRTDYRLDIEPSAYMFNHEQHLDTVFVIILSHRLRDRTSLTRYEPFSCTTFLVFAHPPRDAS